MKLILKTSFQKKMLYKEKQYKNFIEEEIHRSYNLNEFL